MFGGGFRERSTAEEAVSIAIASGKGGTGKSFLATNLAVVLSELEHGVTLTDCDFGLACDHLLLGVAPKRTLQHLLTGQAQLADVQIQTEAGPLLVPGGSGILQMADLSDKQLRMLGSIFGKIVAESDILLLDVGAGIAPQNILTLLCADHIVLVTQPEIAALTDAYAVIKCASQLREDAQFSVVVNRVMLAGQGERTFDKLAQVAMRHAGVELTYLGEIGEDPTVTRRRLGQQPLVVCDPEGETTRAIRAIARRLEAIAGPLGPRTVDSDSCIEQRFREHRLFLN
jgi:flagellar biosynthesis protein FlhG